MNVDEKESAVDAEVDDDGRYVYAARGGPTQRGRA